MSTFDAPPLNAKAPRSVKRAALSIAHFLGIGSSSHLSRLPKQNERDFDHDAGDEQPGAEFQDRAPG